MKYFDYAAATPLDPRVLEETTPYLTQNFANPSSLHAGGREQRKALENARARIAKILGAKPLEIIFTSGSTEGAELAIQGVAGASKPGNVIFSATEHEAILNQRRSLEGAGWEVRILPVKSGGQVDLSDLSKLIDDETSLVSIMYVNNEIGSVQPLTKISQLIEAKRAERIGDRPLYFYSDCAQAGLESLQVSRLGVDLMTMGGAKIYGPAGTGFLYLRTGVELQTVAGGGQERGLRSGTENVAGAIGLAAALEIEQANRESESKRLIGLRDHLWDLIKDIEGIKINGELKNRAPGNLNITIPGASGEEMVAHLDAAGFAVATGSACTAASEEPSHVLLAIGLSREDAESSLRITLGRQNTAEDISELGAAIIKAVERVRKLISNS